MRSYYLRNQQRVFDKLCIRFLYIQNDYFVPGKRQLLYDLQAEITNVSITNILLNDKMNGTINNRTGINNY